MSQAFPRPATSRSIVRLASRLSALVLLAVLASIVPASAQTAVNGRIVYVASGPSTIPFGSPTQTDIWVMNADGSNPQNLTNTSDIDEFSPAWSRDGSRIAYIADAFTLTLTIMDADGANRTSVTAGATYPTWNPDGTEIAYVGTREGGAVNIVIRTLATGVERTITGPVDFGGVSVDVEELEPAWSPTGDKIAFISVRPEPAINPVTGELEMLAQYELLTVNADGTGEQVVSAGAPGSERATFLEEDRAPAWSPDGSMIVFMSQSQAPSCCGPWQIWAVNRDGSAATNLSNDDTVFDMFPAWSPDGALILFTRSAAGGFDLYTMPAPTALPLAAAAARSVSAAVTAAAATGVAVPLTTDGNAQDGAWAPERQAPPAGFALTVAIQGIERGDGSVFSLPRGILCGVDCSETYDPGAYVLLFATPRKGSRFVGWSGACSGPVPVCVVRLTAARSVTATFRRR